MEPTKPEDGHDLAAAIRAAHAESWSARASAGRRLAPAAHAPEISAVLEALLLDYGDTAVCQETAAALLERHDAHGLRLILAALDHAEAPSFPEPTVADHLYGSITSDPRWMTEDGQRQLTAQLEDLIQDPDQAVSTQARALLSSLRQIDR
jgi:hypothetical protein